jgi:hypothetical protein
VVGLSSRKAARRSTSLRCAETTWSRGKDFDLGFGVGEGAYMNKSRKLLVSRHSPGGTGHEPAPER